MIEWWAIPPRGALFAAIAALAWLCASSATSPQPRTDSLAIENGDEFAAPMSSIGPIVNSIEDGEFEVQEDNVAPCCLSGAQLALVPPLAFPHITPIPSISLSLPAPATHPLRC